MIKPSVYLILVLALAVSLQEVCATKDLTEETSRLLPAFVEINELLIDALPNDEQPDKNIAKAEELLNKKKSAQAAEETKQPIVEALELFVSLKETVGKCDSESSMILMDNYQANRGPKADESVGRTKSVFNYYRSEYAKACRADFQKNFHELIKKVGKDDLARVRLAFGMIGRNDFADTSARSKSNVDLLKMPIRFNSSPNAVFKIVLRMVEQFEGVPSKGNLLKAEFDQEKGIFFQPHVPKGIIDDYLLSPCANYRKQLAPVLDPARIDYAIQDKSDQASKDNLRVLIKKLNEDESYLQALVHNRLCGILEHEENIYDTFLEGLQDYVDVQDNPFDKEEEEEELSSD